MPRRIKKLPLDLISVCELIRSAIDTCELNAKQAEASDTGRHLGLTAREHGLRAGAYAFALALIERAAEEEGTTPIPNLALQVAYSNHKKPCEICGKPIKRHHAVVRLPPSNFAHAICARDRARR